MLKKIVMALGYGCGYCVKYYNIFALPQIWLFFPIITFKKFYEEG